MIAQPPVRAYVPHTIIAESGMPAAPDLKQLPVGGRVEDPLRVLDIEHRESAGGAYTTLTLGNRHGALPTAPFWAEERSRVAGIERGAIVHVVGEVGQYNGRRQLKVSAMRLLPRSAVDWRDLLPTVGEVAPYWEPLDRWRAEIRRPRLRRTLDLFYADPEFRGRYEECPASTTGHHAELGGLLKHTCEIAAIGRAIGRVSAGGRRAGPGRGVASRHRQAGGLQLAGRLRSHRDRRALGHVTLGMLMLDRRVRAESPAPCTERELGILQHLIASHHGKPEFGAAVAPMTLEAEVLHFADNASAKTASMAAGARRPGQLRGRRAGERKIALAAGPAASLPWQQRLGRRYRGVKNGTAA